MSTNKPAEKAADASVKASPSTHLVASANPNPAETIAPASEANAPAVRVQSDPTPAPDVVAAPKVAVNPAFEAPAPIGSPRTGTSSATKHIPAPEVVQDDLSLAPATDAVDPAHAERLHAAAEALGVIVKDAKKDEGAAAKLEGHTLRAICEYLSGVTEQGGIAVKVGGTLCQFAWEGGNVKINSLP